MTTKPQPRLDFGPIAELLGPVSMSEMARRLKIDRRQLYRYVHAGVTDRAADHLAVRLGWMPYELWPEWLALALDPDMELPEPKDWVRVCREQYELRRAAEAQRVKATRKRMASTDEAGRPRQPLPARPCERCGTEFVPSNRAHRFHSMNCSEASRSRTA